MDVPEMRPDLDGMTEPSERSPREPIVLRKIGQYEIRLEPPPDLSDEEYEEKVRALRQMFPDEPDSPPFL